MFRKLNTKSLLIIFVALLLIIMTTRWMKKSGNDRNFREYLAKVDTTAVTAVNITPKGKKEPLVLRKSGDQWMLLVNNKTYRTNRDAVASVLQGLLKLKTERLVSSGKETLEKYEVTENSGTTVKVEENGKTAAEFILGKISYDQSFQNVTTFARLKNEEEVYAIAGFLPMNFNHDINSLRYKELGLGSPDKIHRITFSYPSDSSFTLSQTNGKWSLNALPADSASVASYLRTIATSAGNQFADDTVPLTKPLFSILAEGEGKFVLEIKAYPTDSANLFYITSSANPGAIFSESQNGLISQIFPPDKLFLKQ